MINLNKECNVDENQLLNIEFEIKNDIFYFEYSYDDSIEVSGELSTNQIVLNLYSSVQE